MRYEKTVDEIIAEFKSNKDNTPNFKWTSAHGKALSDIITYIDCNFLDRLLIKTDRMKNDAEYIKWEYSKKLKELEKRESDIALKESTSTYPFENQKYRDAYLMSYALRKDFTNGRGSLDSSVACRIVEMVENLVKETTNIDHVDNLTL